MKKHKDFCFHERFEGSKGVKMRNPKANKIYISDPGMSEKSLIAN
jgi:hypothetical protein